MKRIKLDAIDSTNDYLKSLSRQESLQNFTVVTTFSQTKGRGQMGSKWVAEDGKNIIMSILIKNTIQQNNQIFDLNVVISSALVLALETLKIPNLAIKWPNDIMAGNKKIAGILIENTLKADKKIESVVGIGLNVNQTLFLDLPNASSMANVTNQVYDLELVLEVICFEIKKMCQLFLEKNADTIWERYHQYLFYRNIPSLFETNDGTQFEGYIQSVSKQGKLEVKIPNGTIEFFGIKEIKLVF